MKRTFLSLLIAILVLAPTALAADGPLLAQMPALSRTHVVFVYAGDLWRVPRQGGMADRLTAGSGIETNPVFSPDGESLAFTGEYDGNIDVYVMPSEGSCSHPAGPLTPGLQSFSP